MVCLIPARGREQFTADSRVHLDNVEGFSEFRIRPEWWTGRKPGLSAMIRLRNEAEWIVRSLASIEGWCDEIAIFLQGVQSDGTDKIVDAWARGRPRVAVHRYPFESIPNGPGHEKQIAGSVRERAYFYNWCQSLTNYSHCMKWDGDMVALDWLGPQVLELMQSHDVIKFRGLDIVDHQFVSSKPYTANEPRVWRVTPDTWWTSGNHCEEFSYGHHEGRSTEPDVGYLHFKWSKDHGSAIKDWPRDWKRHADLRRRHEKTKRGARYSGEWPSVISDLWARSASARWQDGIAEELRYWRTWLLKRGGVNSTFSGASHVGDFARRFNAKSALDANVASVISGMGLKSARILDVGAGPVTSLGYRLEGVEIAIDAVDPMAPAYALLLAEAKVEPPVKTRFGVAECLKITVKDSYDIVHCRNALDHSVDPLAAIREMIAVTKPGGRVVLVHHRNEGQRGSYGGLHQWNFDTDGGEFIIWNPSVRHALSEHLPAGVGISLSGSTDGDIVAVIDVPA